MDAWKKLGSWIGGHMAFITPTCVILSVVFAEELVVLKPAVSFLFAFMTFQGSLTNTFSNLGHALRHPAPMLVTLAIASVLMPSLACAIGTLLFGSDPDIVTGIVLEYSVPVAVTAAIWVSLFEGDISLCLATILVSTVLSPFTIPATMQLLLGHTVEVDTLSMMQNMLLTIALPALAGTAANDFSHGRAGKELSPVLSPAAKLALIVVILTNSTGAAPYLRHLTPMLVGVLFFIFTFATTGYLLGLVVASVWRRPRKQLITMTFLTGMRNISAGAVIAAQYFPDATMFPVVIGTLFQQMLAAVFGTLMEKVVLPRLGSD